MANTQTSIERQSSLKLALKWASSCGHCLTMNELIGLSDAIVEYCQDGRTPELKHKMAAIDSYYRTIHKSNQNEK